jgi:hypothetical protein
MFTDSDFYPALWAKINSGMHVVSISASCKVGVIFDQYETKLNCNDSFNIYTSSTKFRQHPFNIFVDETY